MGDFNSSLVDEEKMRVLALDWEIKLDLSNFKNILLTWTWICREVHLLCQIKELEGIVFRFDSIELLSL